MKLSKRIPIPDVRTTREPMYPFAKMLVGHSFFVEGGNAKTVRTSACAYARRQGGTVKFKVLTVEGGTRCWRVA